MNNSKSSLVILVLILAIALLGSRYIYVAKQLSQAKAAASTQTVNEKTLAFTKLFIEKVLKADKEVDFETRLSLENSVRSLGNEQILAQWQKFTESKTEAEAQAEVKQLLQDLVNNIK